MKVFYTPKNMTTNPYVKNVIKQLEAEGFEVVEGSLKKAVSDPEINHFIFNWYEKTVEPNWFRAGLIYLKKILLLFLLLIRRKNRLIWVLHNKKTPHSHFILFYILLSILMYGSHSIVIHCKRASYDYLDCWWFSEKLKNKCIYIEHPDYDEDYTNPDKKLMEELTAFKGSRTAYLYFGEIHPHKNVDILLEAFAEADSKDKVLFVAGKGSQPNFVKWVESRYNHCENIRMDIRFLPDDDLAAYLEVSEYCVLLHDEDDVLNSGSVILALNKGKKLISTRVGILKDV